MPRKPTQKTNYSIRRRFFSEIGTPLEWQDTGYGIFDLETVQRQIKTLASVSRKVEIELIKDGKLIGYSGSEIGQSMIFEKR